VTEHPGLADRELARRYDLVREELAETIHLNETLATSTRRSVPVGARHGEAVRRDRRRGGTALRHRRRISPAPSPVTASILNDDAPQNGAREKPVVSG
jgi:hypothetical protein